MSTVTLVLAGHYAGKTIRLAHHQFVDGKITLHGEPKNIEGAIRYLSRSYQAFPAGSAELKAAQAHWDEAHGVQRNPVKTGSPGNPNGVQGDGLQSSREVSTSSTNDGGPNDATRTADGRAGIFSDGSGHGDAGLLPEEVAKIRKALNDLDPAVAEYWTDEGLPSIETMTKVLNDPGITRQTISVAWPDFNREKAIELREI